MATKKELSSEAEATRRNIFHAARLTLSENGILGFTLSEVATRAQVSKGGLLYHFPSKNALLEGLLDYEAETFRRAIDTAAGIEGTRGPGAWTRAYITASFEQVKLGRSLSVAVGALLLNPDLLPRYAEHVALWGELLKEDGLPEPTAQLIRFAVEGLWFDEVCGLRPLDPSQRAAFIDRLLQMTYVDSGEST